MNKAVNKTVSLGIVDVLLWYDNKLITCTQNYNNDQTYESLTKDNHYVFVMIID